MLNPEHFAITLARAVDLFRTHPHAVPDQKTALRALVALTKLGTARVSVEGGELVVEEAVIPRTLPAIVSLTATLERLGVSEIRFAQHASPSDLLHLLRALAGTSGASASGAEGGVEQRLRESLATTISVLSIKPETLLPGEEPMRVTEAFEAVEDQIPPEPRQKKREADRGGSALERLRAEPFGADALDRLIAVSNDVVRALEQGDPAGAVSAIEAMLDFEAEAPQGQPERSYGLAFRRLLTPEVLAQVGALVPDRDLGPAASRIMQRAGADGTQILLRRLAEADTQTERLQYFEALRHIREGTELVVQMLEHHQWFVVRNVADLIGELELESAVPALARALTHYDARVAQAAARALARIGSSAAFDALRRALQGADEEVKLAVASSVEGRGGAVLALPLAQAAEEAADPGRRREFYRALGRIGSPEAVQALLRAVEPGGRFFKRKPVEPRLAAIEGLALLRGPAVRGTLERLIEDGDPRVREAAASALQKVRRSAASEG